MSRWVKSRASLAAFAVSAALACQVLAFHTVRHDDPFITYRYGQNLAEGQGLTFNPGERFLGATSPGHMLLAAVAHALFGTEATPSWMSALGCVGWTLQALAVYALFERVLGVALAALVAAAVELGAATSYCWVPFETNLLTALLLAALLAAQRDRYRLAALCAGLAVLMRPDALVFVGVLGGLAALRLRRAALPHLALLLAVALPFWVFSVAYYGSAIPHSAVEKFQRTDLATYTVHEARLFAETLLPLGPIRPWFLPVVLAVLALAAFGSVLVYRERFMAVLLACAFLHWGAYLVLRPFVGHDWHLYPANLIATCVVLAGLLCCARDARSVPLRVVAGAVVLAIVVAGAVRTFGAAHDYDAGYWTGGRDAAYRRVAQFLRQQALPGDEFASVEVGTIAYYANLPAYDLGGLVTDLRRTHMIDRPVRFLVLDGKYLRFAPKWPPALVAEAHGFQAFVYVLPRRGHR